MAQPRPSQTHQNVAMFVRNPLLEPVVIGIIPRWSEAAQSINEMEMDHALALAESEKEAKLFRDHWNNDQFRPLLLLRTDPGKSAAVGVEAILEISSRNPARSVAILLFDGPSVSGYRDERRFMWNREFAKSMADEIVDVQIHEFAKTWLTHPPRIR